jgi:short-subunit dehydrogenase
MITKTALVTGISRVIEPVFARELAKEKEAYTVACVTRNEEKDKRLVDGPVENHHNITANLTDIDPLNKVSQDIRTPHYSLLVNITRYGMN